MLSGSLDAFSLPDVFALLAMTKKTGVLSIRGQADGRVDFRDGEIAYAVSDTRRMALASRLLGGGLVDEEQLRHVVAAQRGGAAALSRVLHDEGLLSPELFDTFVREQIQDAVFELMRQTDGSFSFAAEAEEEGDDAVRVRVPSDQLVAEGARRLDDWAQIKGHVISFSALVTLAPRPATESVTVSMEPAQWQLLTFVDGRRTVRDLVDLTGRGEYATCQVIAGLVKEGLVEVVDPAAGGRTRVSELVARHELLRRLEERELGAAVRGPAPRVPRTTAPEPVAPRPPSDPSRDTTGPSDRTADPTRDAGEPASAADRPPAVESDEVGQGRGSTEMVRPVADSDGAGQGRGVNEMVRPVADSDGAGQGRGVNETVRPVADSDGAGQGRGVNETVRPVAEPDGAEQGRGVVELIGARHPEGEGRPGPNGLRRPEGSPRRADQPGPPSRQDAATPPDGIPALGRGARPAPLTVVDDRHEDPPASVFDAPVEPPLGVVVDVVEVVNVAEVTELRPGDQAAVAGGRHPAEHGPTGSEQPATAEPHANPSAPVAADGEAVVVDEAPDATVIGYREDAADQEPPDTWTKEEEDAFDRAEVERELAALGFRSANRAPDDDAQPGNPFRVHRPDDATRGGLLSRLMDGRKQP